MKCPKCGYNSFEFHDTCKKCSNDLTGFKNTYGLKSIILPPEARTAMAQTLMAATAAADQSEEAAAETSDMFSFDLPEEEPGTAAVPPQNDPFSFVNAAEEKTTSFGEFSFDEEPATQKSAPEPPPPAAPEEDAFASLLESTSQGGDDPFAAPVQTAAPKAPATSSPGEFDLDSFSWDEPATTPAQGDQKTEDNFDSLFGDSDTAKK